MPTTFSSRFLPLSSALNVAPTCMRWALANASLTVTSSVRSRSGNRPSRRCSRLRRGSVQIRHRDRTAGGRLGQTRHVKQRQVGDARLCGGDAGDGGDAVGDGFRGARVPRQRYRRSGSAGNTSRGFLRANDRRRLPSTKVATPRGDHQRDGQRLRPHVPQIPHQLAVEHAHGDLPADLGGLLAGRVDLCPGDAPVAEEEHAMRHVLDGGVVGDECGGGPQLPVDLR